MRLTRPFDDAAAYLRDPGQFSVPRLKRECPICGYCGAFYSAGKPPRYEARCPSCRSRERHRLVHLYLAGAGVDLGDGRAVLHFAPEKHAAKRYARVASYHTADIVPGKAKLTLDAQAIDRPDGAYDVVIANHVLEHAADDRRALRELFRVLSINGLALITVPQDWSLDTTYETAAATTPALRFAYYGDRLHLRLYGRDFSARMRAAGFRVEEFRASPQEEARYGLCRSEILYVGRKAPPP